VVYRFYANDTAGNVNVTTDYSFTVVRSIADVSIYNPPYPINRYVYDTFWVNATTTAVNGSVMYCNLTPSYDSGLTLVSQSRQSAGNLSNGTSYSGTGWLFNSTAPGTYLMNITSNCTEGDSRTASSVEIEITPLKAEYTNKSYAERVLIGNVPYYHLSSETEADWWVSESDEYMSFNSSGLGGSWMKAEWDIIINDTLVLDFTNLTVDYRKTGVDSSNKTFVHFVGRFSNPGLRLNYTKRISANSKFDNVSLTVENMDDSVVENIKLLWTFSSVDIGLNTLTDTLSLTNSSSQPESHPMNSSTSLNYQQADFDTPTIYFTDSGFDTNAMVYWEWTMSTDGSKGSLKNFTMAAGSAFVLNMTFDLGNLTPGEIKALDPGAGLITPDLIQRTDTISNPTADETGTTYTDVTVPLTDSDPGTTDYAMTRVGDQVQVLNILNRTEVSVFDSVFLRVYLSDISPLSYYPIKVYSYNVDNVTVTTTSSVNYTFDSSQQNSWVQINITDLAHLQDSRGFLRVRLAPNSTAIGNNRRIYFSEIRFNLTDETAPKINLHAPVDGLNTTNTTQTFNWTADDRVDTNLTCNITVNGIEVASDIDSLDEQPRAYKVENLSGGWNFWNITCWDDEGNLNTSSTRLLVIVHEPQNFTASLAKDNESIVLNWSAFSWADSYMVFISDNHSAFSVVPNVTQLTDSNWTDSAASDVTKRFYKVAAERSGVNSTTTTITAKHTITLAPEWNLISLPLNLSEYELLNQTNNAYNPPVRPYRCVTEIWQYNHSLADDWLMVTYEPDYWEPATGDESFTHLKPELGYWFYNNLSQQCNLTVVGWLPLHNTSIELDENYTMVSWHSEDEPALPQNCDPPYPVEVNPLNSVNALYYYDPAAHFFRGTFHYTSSVCSDDDWGWVPDGSSLFTNMIPGYGYYINAVEEATWTVESTR
jgi:hypothetical protein